MKKPGKPSMPPKPMYGDKKSGGSAKPMKPGKPGSKKGC